MTNDPLASLRERLTDEVLKRAMYDATGVTPLSNAIALMRQHVCKALAPWARAQQEQIAELREELKQHVDIAQEPFTDEEMAAVVETRRKMRETVEAAEAEIATLKEQRDRLRDGIRKLNAWLEQCSDNDLTTLATGTVLIKLGELALLQTETP